MLRHKHYNIVIDFSCLLCKTVEEVPSITNTVDFLESYMNSTGDARKYSTEEIVKDKMPITVLKWELHLFLGLSHLLLLTTLLCVGDRSRN